MHTRLCQAVHLSAEQALEDAFPLPTCSLSCGSFPPGGEVLPGDGRFDDRRHVMLCRVRLRYPWVRQPDVLPLHSR